MRSLAYVVVYDLMDTRPIIHDPNDWPRLKETRTYQNGQVRKESRTRCGRRVLETETTPKADGTGAYYATYATPIMTRHALPIAHVCRSCFPDGLEP